MQPGLSFPSPERSAGIRAELGGFHERHTPDRSSVYLEFNVRADARRLFHALTVPEYLEAWVSLPGHNLGCSTAAARSNQDYVIEHYCEGSPALTITGTYSVCRRRNVVFSWRVDGNLSIPETEVNIRLRGNFESTTLIVRHTGFAAEADCAWHQALWTVSMRRLVALYDSPSYRSEHSRSPVGRDCSSADTVMQD
jgi:uncharacterized protein YndB with AHSA1/START domain